MHGLAIDWSPRAFDVGWGAEAMPIGAKSQEAQTQLLLDMLSRHPAGLGSAALKARAASFCGDGALSMGGTTGIPAAGPWKRYGIVCMDQGWGCVVRHLGLIPQD